MSDQFAQRVLHSWVSQNPYLSSDDNIFRKPRAEGEPDLVGQCRQIMTDHGLAARLPAFDMNRYVMDAVPLGFEAQRFLLNKYWTIQLLSVSGDTQKARFCLAGQGTPEDWVNAFKLAVVPALIEHQLPREL